jgi:RimJ/RimL family protein N-acetyltransferase
VVLMQSLFQGDTVVLRPFEADDVAALLIYLNHPDLAGCRYVPWGIPELAPLSRRQGEDIYQKWSQKEKGLLLAVVQRESGSLIGHAECDWQWDPHCPSLSVVIAPVQRRHGYGSEALHLLLNYAFAYTPAHVVSAWMADWNQPARQFAARHGFREAGRMRRVGLRQGSYFDLVVADLLRREWLAAQGQ